MRLIDFVIPSFWPYLCSFFFYLVFPAFLVSLFFFCLFFIRLLFLFLLLYSALSSAGKQHERNLTAGGEIIAEYGE